MGVAIKRFLGNKNTVTIVGILLGIVVLYIGYSWRVNSALELVSVPIAKDAISSRTRIEADMLSTVQLPRATVNKLDNLVTSQSEIVGKYLSYGTSVSQNSMFFDEYLMNEEEMPDSAFADIPDGYTIYSLNVDLHKTYGNSIYPGNYIDLYFKSTDNQKIIFGKLIESIEVLAVKDSSGNHVFETTKESRTPSEILFAVPNDMYSLLMKASYISGVEILPVPRNASYSANPGDTNVSSAYIQEYIESKSIALPDESE